jgi:hypothetical protein
MVSGVVTPPRLDLLNEDLLRSHVHAIWLAEAGLKLGRSIPESIDMAGTEPGGGRPNPELRLVSNVSDDIHAPEAARRTIRRAQRIVDELGDDLRTRTSWWDEGWVENAVKAAPAAFDRAFDRWRELYRGALVEQWTQNRLTNTMSLEASARNLACRRRGEAESQLRLLRSEDTDDRNLAADFNPYRYLASEGFLPGYSFPRLPLAAYIPAERGYRDQGDYVQRARFLAIREFGPRALIYHEGNRYEVHRVQLPPDADSDDAGDQVGTGQGHRCPGCGYFYDVAPGNDKCEVCDSTLDDTMRGLFQLRTVFTRQRQRITSDEEERRRAGYRLVTAFRFQNHGDRPGRLDALVRDENSSDIARLAYGDSADIHRINLGPVRRPEGESDGFWLDPVTGEWLSSRQAADRADTETGGDEGRESGQRRRVIPYVRDRRNILVVQLTDRVDGANAVSVMYALERGIEAAFQLEDAELDSELLPPDSGPRDRFLLTESAEGGAGVLRRLQAEPGALAEAAREALRIAHFDPDTGADLGGVRDAQGTVTNPCARGCYNCLLSYGNQLSHELIDRHLAKPLLLAIAHGETLPTGIGETRTEQLGRLKGQSDSSLEERFLQWLKDNGYRLPDAAQQTVEEAYARPDFIYYQRGGNVALFVDGPVHDDPHVAERDADADERLTDAGWNVIRLRYDDDWPQFAATHQAIFGARR